MGKVSPKVMKELEAQRQWIEDHGGSLNGYLQRYGFPHDPDHYGDGGFAIYGADLKELYRLERLAGLRPWVN